MTDLIEHARNVENDQRYCLDRACMAAPLVGDLADEIERLRAEAEMWKASHDSAVKEAYKKRCALQAKVDELEGELRRAKAKITILSDLLTDKCDELKELANKQEPDDE